jgi:tRNA threonylcarbamoyladenosine biosynthesis protein TsaE
MIEHDALTDPILTLHLPDAEATGRLGAAFATILNAGDTVLLDGQIGAGKTHFARSVIQEILARHGIWEDVPSPTFTLVQTYEAEGVEIWHADLYRLSNPSEVDELGLTDAFGNGLCFVEWPDRLGPHLPSDALRIAFRLDGDGRTARLYGDNRWAERLAGADL